MSDAERPESAAEAGKQVADPEDMSTNTNGHTKVAEAVNGFAEMSMERVGGTRYRVLSWRNGGLRTHKVNTDQLTCTCEDFNYNVDRNEMEVCDHLAYAVYHAPKDRDVDQEAFLNLMMALDSMNDYRNALEQRRNQMDSAESSQSSETDERPSLEETTPDPTHDPDEKADALKAAFDAVVADMEVEVGDGGAIWVKTGYDTPDSIENPGPGGPIDVWEAFIRDPEQTEYVPDDHPAAGDRPSQYHKNRIEPCDVDEYISEVLE